MHTIEVPEFFGLLCAALGLSKILGMIAKSLGQPAVLGELATGVLLGPSLLGLVDAGNETIHLLSELGVAILLFEIGLETDLRQLLRVGGASIVVALAGVALPFALGFAACRIMGESPLTAIVAGATLTATSIGITARVLADLGRLQDAESQIVLGAAVFDDVVGLIILAVVAKLTQGQEVTLESVGRISLEAFGFLVAALLVGRLAVPPLLRLLSRTRLRDYIPTLAILIALGLAWLGWKAGSAPILGAFAAGLLVRGALPEHEIEKGVAPLGRFFVPIFFVAVGAAVDVRVFDPRIGANHRTLLLAALLVVVAVAGKFLAGYAPFWFRGKKSAIGVGMIPRGEVGLIFAQLGKETGVFDDAFFSAITLTVMVTTFLAPPLLRYLSREPPGDEQGRMKEAPVLADRQGETAGPGAGQTTGGNRDSSTQGRGAGPL